MYILICIVHAFKDVVEAPPIPANDVTIICNTKCLSAFVAVFASLIVCTMKSKFSLTHSIHSILNTHTHNLIVLGNCNTSTVGQFFYTIYHTLYLRWFLHIFCILFTISASSPPLTHLIVSYKANLLEFTRSEEKNLPKANKLKLH